MKQHSDDLAAEDGGDRGWVKRGDLRGDLIDAAFALKAGEIRGKNVPVRLEKGRKGR